MENNMQTGFTGCPKIRGTFLGGPCNKHSSILGSIVGSPPLCGNYYKSCNPQKRYSIALPALKPYSVYLNYSLNSVGGSFRGVIGVLQKGM